MSDDTIRRQDAGGSYGIFFDGRLLAPAPDNIDDAYSLRDELARWSGVPATAYEVLVQCPDHPDYSAVDCIECEPS